eukprot:CAMPEP_0172683326 /NCGR_PEP_ID=MMETSP1074-20121228/18776_1 /TAXON_ID=2916 /ORGANISM="Ceratium fusus, Strain PA161109" /LENGTH=427 /DNA_ID=CAMNT_0013502159 /DNA_START=55 /DNA_END=1338 /DNA_ORIENTATION=+
MSAGSAPVASARAITLNLIAMGLGSGLLTMPWGVAGASVLNSVILLAIVLALNFWTITILVGACERWQVFDLGSLLSKLPGRLGPGLQGLVNVILWFSQLLVLIGYTTVIRDSSYDMLPEQTFLRHKWLLTFLTGVIMIPLCFLDQAYLSFTSTLAILANTYLIILLVAYIIIPDMLPDMGNQAVLEPRCIFGVGANSLPGIVCMFSLLMYTIIMQMAIPPMYKELAGRSPRKFQRCLLVAFVCLFAIFSTVMVCGYVAWGSKVNSNILNALPTDMWGNAARFGMMLCLVGCYPLNVKPMVAPCTREEHVEHVDLIESKTAPLLQKPGRRSHGTRLPSCLIVASCTVLSSWATNLGSLNAMNGAIQVIGYGGFIPGAAGLYLLGSKTSMEQLMLWLLMAFATTMSVVGSFATDNNVEGMITDCVLTM